MHLCLFCAFGLKTPIHAPKTVFWGFDPLNGASPVLTATLSMGKGTFQPLQNRHPSTDHQKFVTGDYVSDPYSCANLGAHPSTGGGLLGTWVKYNQNYCYL